MKNTQMGFIAALLALATGISWITGVLRFKRKRKCAVYY